MAEAPSVSGDTIYASLWYPRNEGDGIIRRINIGMYEVRAAGSFNISYDFERDGYVATQEVMIEHKTWMESTGEFREVAFIPAWLVADTDEPKDSITFNTDDLGPATDIDGDLLADTDEE